MTRDKAIKVVQKLIRLYLAKHGYQVEKADKHWQWRVGEGAAKAADDELGAILAASEALIRSPGGTAACPGPHPSQTYSIL